MRTAFKPFQPSFICGLLRTRLERGATRHNAYSFLQRIYAMVVTLLA